MNNEQGITNDEVFRKSNVMDQWRVSAHKHFQILKLIPIIIPFDIQLLKPITKN